MKVFEYPREKCELERKLLGRKRLYDRKLIQSVSEIFEKVDKGGDHAIRELTSEHDKTELASIQVEPVLVGQAVSGMGKPLKDAIFHAMKNIEEVNRYLMPKDIETFQIRPGTLVGEKISPLRSVGLWVPARKRPLISTALMLVTAAKVAGVKSIYVGMAPTIDGQADAATVAACNLAGADKIFLGNGVGIIAGFCVGTETIPEVDGIFGPGPGGIAAAMSVAFSYGKKTVLGIGPTDSAIICDGTPDPRPLVFDLLNEAEHGKDSSSILVTTSHKIADEVSHELARAIADFPDKARQQNLRHIFSDEGLGAIVYTRTIKKAVDLINDYAPEHMIVKCSEANKDQVLRNVENAGEILIGEYTPFSAGNYAIGVTAVLPTNGYARTVSGITCKDMLKISTIGQLDKEALQELLPTIREIGRGEGLPNHVLAAEKRFD